MNDYVINLIWDQDVHVWIATSDDIPGLVLEHGSFDALLERVRVAVPELLALNAPGTKEISIHYNTQRQERLAV